MRKLLMVLVAAMMMLGILAPQMAGAQGVVGQDHLLCRLNRDPIKVAYAMDLIAKKQPEFSAKNCVVKPKSIVFCVPVTKLNVQPNPKRPDIVGPALDFDYVGFKIKCKEPLNPPRKLVSDQLGGDRIMHFGKPVLLFVPATKQNPPCGFVARRQCGGECPTGEQCIPKPDDSGCECKPPPRPCGRDAAGVCAGDCPNPSESCHVNTAGECMCEPHPCGLTPGTNQCSGDCPNVGEICRTFTDPTGLVTCDCVH